MGFRFIHTADLQIGKTFGSFPDEVASKLRGERLEVVKRIANLASERKIDAILVAGDCFDKISVSDDTLRRFKVVILLAPLQRMREVSDLTEWFDSHASDRNVIRIGLAHGSVTGILPDSHGVSNPIAPDRCEKARLVYRSGLLGSVHNTLQTYFLYYTHLSLYKLIIIHYLLH